VRSLPGGGDLGDVRAAPLGRVVDSRVPKAAGGPTTTAIAGLAPGAYTVSVTGLQPSSPIAPVSTDVLVWEG
jgi:hypothetical protein